MPELMQCVWTIKHSHQSSSSRVLCGGATHWRHRTSLGEGEYQIFENIERNPFERFLTLETCRNFSLMRASVGDFTLGTEGRGL
jgi:hypothetical protein